MTNLLNYFSIFVCFAVSQTKGRGTWNASGNYEYYASNLAVFGSYDDGMKFCQDNDGELALVKTSDIQSFLEQLVTGEGSFPYAFFIGLRYLSGTFVWNDGESLSYNKSLSYNNWRENEPSLPADATCVVAGQPFTYSAKLGWDDITCGAGAKGFFCQRLIGKNWAEWGDWSNCACPGQQQRTRSCTDTGRAGPDSCATSGESATEITTCWLAECDVTTPALTTTERPLGRGDWFAHGNFEYYVSAKSDGVSYTESQEYCNEEYGGELALVKSAEVQSFIVSLVPSESGVPYAFYIGLRYDVASGEFLWTDGKPLEYEYWKLGEPNRADGEDCVAIGNKYIYEPGLPWHDYQCVSHSGHGKKGLVCQRRIGTYWSPWGEWSSCSCVTTNHSRNRSCVDSGRPGPDDCLGATNETQHTTIIAGATSAQLTTTNDDRTTTAESTTVDEKTTTAEEHATIVKDTTAMTEETTTKLLQTTTSATDVTTAHSSTIVDVRTTTAEDHTTIVKETTAMTEETTAKLFETTTSANEVTTAHPSTTVDERTTTVEDHGTIVKETTAMTGETTTKLLETTTSAPEVTTAHPSTTVDDRTTTIEEHTTIVKDTTAMTEETTTKLLETTTTATEVTTAHPSTTVDERTTTVEEHTTIVKYTTAMTEETTTKQLETTTSATEVTTAHPSTTVDERTTTVEDHTTIVKETTAMAEETTTELSEATSAAAEVKNAHSSTAVDERKTTVEGHTTIVKETTFLIEKTTTELLEVPSATAPVSTAQATTTALDRITTVGEYKTIVQETTEITTEFKDTTAHTATTIKDTMITMNGDPTTLADSTPDAGGPKTMVGEITTTIVEATSTPSVDVVTKTTTLTGTTNTGFHKTGEVTTRVSPTTMSRPRQSTTDADKNKGTDPLHSPRIVKKIECSTTALALQWLRTKHFLDPMYTMQVQDNASGQTTNTSIQFLISKPPVITMTEIHPAMSRVCTTITTLSAFDKTVVVEQKVGWVRGKITAFSTVTHGDKKLEKPYRLGILDIL